MRTEDDRSWTEGVDGCGVACENPVFTSDEHAQMHRFIAIMAALCLMLTFFTIVSCSCCCCKLGIIQFYNLSEPLLCLTNLPAYYPVFI